MILHGNRLIAACAGLLGLAAADTSSNSGNLQKRALVVGVGHYPPADGWAEIDGAVRDAVSMSDLLVRRFGFPANQVVTLLDGEATREAILQQFQSHLIEKSDENTLALFYFAGHGSQLHDENDDEADALDETLVPINSLDKNSKDGKTRKDIRDDEIDALVESLSARANQVVLLFDCCHSGTVHRGSSTDSGSQSGVVPRYVPPFLERGLEGRPKSGRHDRMVAVDAERPSATVFVLSACLDYQSAMSLLPEYFGLPEERGLFTLGLERAMHSLPRDATFGLLFQRTKLEMKSLFEDQNPLFLGQWDAPFLSGDYEAPVQRFLVESVNDDGLLMVAAGTAQGIARDTRLVIEPPANASEFGTERTLVAVAEDVLGPARSTARLVAPPAAPARLTALTGGTARILERAAPDFRVRLALPPEWRESLEQGLRDSPYLETRAAGESSARHELNLQWSSERGFEVFGPGGSSILPRPPLLDRIDQQDQLLRNLEKYAVWRALCVIENQPTELDSVEVKFEFGHLTDVKSSKSFMAEPCNRDAAGLHLIRQPQSGEQFYQPAVKVSVRNPTNRTLYFWIMDLQPDWAIVPLCPDVEGESDHVESGVPVRRDVEERVYKLNWDGHTNEPSSVEALKVFVSEDKVDLSYLAMAGITAAPSKRPPLLVSATRGGSGNSALGKLLASFSSGTRGAPSSSTGTWMTSTTEFRFLWK